MSLHGELREVIFGEDQEMRMVWLQQRGLIASQKTCRKCDSDMRFGAKSNMTDGFVWRCKRKGCKTCDIFDVFNFVISYHKGGGGVYSNDHLNIRHPMHRGDFSGAGVTESEPRSVTSKNGKHGVQNMENTEYKIWKTRSMT